MGILDALFRYNVGAPSKSEILKNGAAVYKVVEDKKAEIEGRALQYLEKQPEWILSLTKENALMSNYDGNDSDFLAELNDIRDEREKMIADYVDSGDDNIIISDIKFLQDYQSRNIKSKGFDSMSFENWQDIKDSSELACLIRTELETSRAYLDAEKIDRIIESYYKRKMLKKGMRK